MRKLFFLLVFLNTLGLTAQTQVGDKWVDNDLSLQIEYEDVRKTGVFTFCIYQTVRKQCIENLTTGLHVEVQDASGKVLWKGTAMGRKKSMKLPGKYPNAAFLVLKAFKPFVVNKNTGTRIHQDETLELKYSIK